MAFVKGRNSTPESAGTTAIAPKRGTRIRLAGIPTGEKLPKKFSRKEGKSMSANKKVAIMQPYFLPYIGYWQLIKSVDVFVIYDDVNYIKNGWILFRHVK
mgnify:CR=1 FL=1